MKQLVDGFGRVHDYLRISVTDQCNLRCVYCMPEEGMEFEPPEHLLSSEEIYEIVKVAAKMGIKKLRLTGGEPTVRKDLTELVQKLSAVPEIEDIALTTNGVLSGEKGPIPERSGYHQGEHQPRLHEPAPLCGDYQGRGCKQGAASGGSLL